MYNYNTISTLRRSGAEVRTARCGIKSVGRFGADYTITGGPALSSTEVRHSAPALG